MKNGWFVFIMLFIVSCSTQPELPVIGKDVCASCKMPFSDIKYSAEIITSKGRIYKFDDIICLRNFLKDESGTAAEVKTTLVIDYSDNKRFLNVTEASFLISSNFHTPMNSGVAAFKSKKEAELCQANFPGKIVSWEELLQITL